MMANMSRFNTDPRLLQVMQNLPARKMTQQEILEQKASFVFGSIGDKTNITKEQVLQGIKARAGIE